MSQPDNPFTIFRKKNYASVSVHKVPEIYYMLDIEQQGACLRTVNAKGTDIQPDYNLYSGIQRELIYELSRIQESLRFQINWDNPESKVYLANYSSLIPLLKKIPNLVDQQLEPVYFVEQPGQIKIKIDPQVGDDLKAIIILQTLDQSYDDFQLLDDSHILCQRGIYSIASLGPAYQHLFLFKAIFHRGQLEKYLSLLFSQISNVDIEYADYELIEGILRKCRISLIFEKMEIDNSLVMRFGNSLQEETTIDSDFLNEYDVQVLITVNDDDHSIIRHTIEYIDNSSIILKFLQRLKILSNRLKKAGLKDYSFHQISEFYILEQNLARELITQDLVSLAEDFIILGSENLKSYNFSTKQPRLRLALDHGIDFLEGDASLDFDGQNIPLFTALNEYRKKNYILLHDGTKALLNEGYVRKLERLFKKKSNQKVEISFFDLPLVENLISERMNDSPFERSREFYKGFNALAKKKVPLPELKAELRQYQVEGYKWIDYLGQYQMGGCLADDMGLGKTLQTLAIISKFYTGKKPGEEKPSMVIMPKSLLYNWENEIKKFCPKIPYYVYYQAERDLEKAKKNHLILTTYGMIRNDIKAFLDVECNYLILDESQRIKNLNSQTTKAVLMLKGERRLALSGTPIENNLGELYALFRFLNPAMLGSIENFSRKYANPIQKEENKEVTQELRKKIYPFILRRLKKDVLKDLPEKIEQHQIIEMSKDQMQLYETRRLSYKEMVKDHIGKHGLNKSQFFILQAFNELRQIATLPESKSNNRIISPKREFLLESLMDAIANGHKVLVFVNYLLALDLIGEDLEKNGVGYLTMSGSTDNRQSLVDRFQKERKIKVFLMTLKTGGVGLNLTAADTVYIFDPWWNLAAENQAIDRTHRIGQQNSVSCYKLISKGTIEEKMVELQERKKELFDNLIESDSGSIKVLAEKDIDYIFGK